MNVQDIKIQAQWEIDLDAFEKAVTKEKGRLLEKRSVFPWRINITNINKEKSKWQQN